MKLSCEHAPLRMFMGLQMLCWGAFIETRGFSSEWLWAVVMVCGGAWIILTAMGESYIRNKWPRIWTPVQRRKYRLLTKYTVFGYFFSGAVWGGMVTHAMYDWDFEYLDFLGPLYMMFLFYLAFSDASKKRKGVESNNEKTRNANQAALLHAATNRIHAERVGR